MAFIAEMKLLIIAELAGGSGETMTIALDMSSTEVLAGGEGDGG